MQKIALGCSDCELAVFTSIERVESGGAQGTPPLGMEDGRKGVKMFEFWTVFGRACMDATFRSAVQRVACQMNHKEMQRFLARAPFDLRMSRLEAANIQHFFSQCLYDQLGEIDHYCPSEDVDFPEDLEYCSVVGVALMDSKFRQELHGYATVCDVYGLEAYLAGDTPKNYIKFNISESRLQDLMTLMESDTAIHKMDEAARIGWRPPEENGGASKKLWLRELLTEESICPEGVIFEEVENIVWLEPGFFRNVVLYFAALFNLSKKNESQIMRLLLEKAPWLKDLLDELPGPEGRPVSRE